MTSSGLRIKRYIFDLDGTLFDTKARVREAYMLAGVFMPEEEWGKPASAWLPELAGKRWTHIHQRKNEIYLQSLQRFPLERTSAARAMIELSLSGCETYVVTGASRPAAHLLLSGFQPYHYRLLGVSCDQAMKITKMKMLGRPEETVWVDDDVHTCSVMREHGCKILWYSTDMTKEEVIRPWARSFSQPDAESA